MRASFRRCGKMRNGKNIGRGKFHLSQIFSICCLRTYNMMIWQEEEEKKGKNWMRNESEAVISHHISFLWSLNLIYIIKFIVHRLMASSTEQQRKNRKSRDIVTFAQRISSINCTTTTTGRRKLKWIKMRRIRNFMCVSKLWARKWVCISNWNKLYASILICMRIKVKT